MNRHRKEMWNKLGSAGISVIWLITCTLSILNSIRHNNEMLFYVWHAIALFWVVFLIIYLREAYLNYRDMSSAKKVLNAKTKLP